MGLTIKASGGKAGKAGKNDKSASSNVAKGYVITTEQEVQDEQKRKASLADLKRDAAKRGSQGHGNVGYGRHGGHGGVV